MAEISRSTHTQDDQLHRTQASSFSTAPHTSKQARETRSNHTDREGERGSATTETRKRDATRGDAHRRCSSKNGFVATPRPPRGSIRCISSHRDQQVWFDNFLSLESISLPQIIADGCEMMQSKCTKLSKLAMDELMTRVPSDSAYIVYFDSMGANHTGRQRPAHLSGSQNNLCPAIVAHSNRKPAAGAATGAMPQRCCGGEDSSSIQWILLALDLECRRRRCSLHFQDGGDGAQAERPWYPPSHAAYSDVWSLRAEEAADRL